MSTAGKIALLAVAASAAPASAQGDPQRGARIFVQCQACHSIQRGAPDKIGPNLNGIIGKPAGARPGYAYSAKLVEAKLRWDDATLDRWLARPAAIVPGTKMIFAGLPRADDRAAVIAFLKKSR